MRPQSAKAKGRRLQKAIAEDLNETLHTTDFVSRPMGSQGSDVIMGEKGKELVYPFTGVEAKNVERLNLWAAWEQAKAHTTEPLIVVSKNKSETLVAMRWTAFLYLMERRLLRETD